MQLVVNLFINGIVEGLITAMVALAIVASYSIARFPNAAAGDLATAGAYVVIIAYTQLAFGLILSALTAAAAVGAIALAFHLLVFRKLVGKGYVAPLLASIGLAFFLRHTLALIVGHDPVILPAPLLRAFNFHGVYVQPTDLIIIGIASAVLFALYVISYRTGIGREIRAIADSSELAEVSGIRTGRVLVVVWFIAGAVAGLSGFLLSLKAVIQPEVGWHLLLAGFAAAIVGGLTSFPGALLGGLLIGIAQEVSVIYLGGSYKVIMPFAAILLTLLLRPNGLLGYHQALR